MYQSILCTVLADANI